MSSDNWFKFIDEYDMLEAQFEHDMEAMFNGKTT
jgi:hypothetical protein